MELDSHMAGLAAEWETEYSDGIGELYEGKGLH
jgi:hypothetical protein